MAMPLAKPFAPRNPLATWFQTGIPRGPGPHPGFIFKSPGWRRAWAAPQQHAGSRLIEAPGGIAQWGPSLPSGRFFQMRRNGCRPHHLRGEWNGQPGIANVTRIGAGVSTIRIASQFNTVPSLAAPGLIRAPALEQIIRRRIYQAPGRT